MRHWMTLYIEPRTGTQGRGCKNYTEMMGARGRRLSTVRGSVFVSGCSALLLLFYSVCLSVLAVRACVAEQSGKSDHSGWPRAGANENKRRQRKPDTRHTPENGGRMVGGGAATTATTATAAALSPASSACTLLLGWLCCLSARLLSRCRRRVYRVNNGSTWMDRCSQYLVNSRRQMDKRHCSLLG